MNRFLAVVLLSCAILAAHAQAVPARTQIDPLTQINWPRVAGSGAPSSGQCSSIFYGLPYTDVTNGNQYVCSAGGWLKINGTASALSTTGANGTFWGVQSGTQQWLGAVASINGSYGAFSFTGAGVSCTGTTCAFNGGAGSAVEVNSAGTLPAVNLTNGSGAGEVDFTNPSGSTVNATLRNTTISGVSLGNVLFALTFGAHLTAGGSTYNGGSAVTITSDAASADTASTLVARDASGNFSAGTVTAALTGNASTATALAGGSANAVPYQTNTGATGYVSPVDSAVLSTNSSGLPSESSTLPSGLTIPGYAACTAGTTGSDCLQLSGGVIPYGTIPFGTATHQAAQGGVITAGGPTGGATAIPVVTYNAAGQLTAVTTATPTVATVQGGASNDLLYQSSANTTGFVTPVDSALLVTSSGGVPSESTTLPSGLTIPGYAPLASPTFTGTVTAAALTATGTPTFTNIEGAGTYCVQVSSSGVLSNTGAACGTGSGAVNSVTNSDGTLTISPTTGSVVASLDLANANTWTGKQTFGTEISVGGVTPSGATGTGNLVFATSPTLVTPALGTPASGVITNLTGTCAACTANAATNVAGGAVNDVHYQTGAGATGFVTPVNNAVLVTSSGGAPSESTTLPSSLTIPSPTLSGTVAGANTVPLGVLAQVAADSLLGNSTGSTANVTAAYTVGSSGSDVPQLSGGLMAASTLPKATTSAFGAVEGDGATTTLTSGVISCTTATTSQIGCAKPDGSTITISGGAISASGVVTAINSATGAFTFSGSGVSCTGTTCTFTGAGSGIGSITWSMPSFMAASPSTISASGTQTFSFNNQTANTLLAGPSSGSAATPTFRALVNADFPNTLAPTIAVTNMTGTGAFSTSGNAGTATALAAAPTACTLPQVALGVAASGNASCSEPSNVTGTAANLSGTPALPNGATATTQSTGDGTAKLATDAFVDASLVANPISINGTSCALGGSCSPVVPVTIVSTSTVTLGGSYSVGIAYNENATASQAVTATLPTPVAGKVFCIKNFYNGVSPNTGTLELLVANTSTQYIVFNGAISSSGYVISSGASGDYGCVTGVDSLHWDFTPSVGTWVLH